MSRALRREQLLSYTEYFIFVLSFNVAPYFHLKETFFLFNLLKNRNNQQQVPKAEYLKRYQVVGQILFDAVNTQLLKKHWNSSRFLLTVNKYRMNWGDPGNSLSEQILSVSPDSHIAHQTVDHNQRRNGVLFSIWYTTQKSPLI